MCLFARSFPKRYTYKPNEYLEYIQTFEINLKELLNLCRIRSNHIFSVSLNIKLTLLLPVNTIIVIGVSENNTRPIKTATKWTCNLRNSSPNYHKTLINTEPNMAENISCLRADKNAICFPLYFPFGAENLT